jgi:hypothetical protein
MGGAGGNQCFVILSLRKLGDVQTAAVCVYNCNFMCSEQGSD